MLFSVEQAFVGGEEIRAPLKRPAWEAKEEAEEQIVSCILSEKRRIVLRLEKKTMKGFHLFGNTR